MLSKRHFNDAIQRKNLRINYYELLLKLLKGLCKRAGVKYFSFHALRHYGASKLASEGEALTDIQALLGHMKATTTDIYLQSLSQSKRRAPEKLTP